MHADKSSVSEIECPKTTHIKEFIGEIYFSLDYNTFAIAAVIISYINYIYFTQTRRILLTYIQNHPFIVFHIIHKFSIVFQEF